MGVGGFSFSKMISKDPDIKIVGVANRGQKTEGMKWAKSKGLYTTADFKKLVKKRGLDLIIDTTGNPDVEEYLNNHTPAGAEVAKGAYANLIWKLVERREEKEREAQKSLAEQKMLYDIGLTLSNLEKSDQALNLIVKAAMDLLEMSAGSAALYNEEKGEMKTEAALGFKAEDMDEVNFTWAVRPGGFTSHVLSNERPTVIEDLQKDQLFDASKLKNYGLRSLIALPLKAEGKIVGALFVDHKRPRKFSNREIKLMGLLGVMAGSAIEKILMLERAEEMALTDELTKIYNHRYFINTLKKELKRAERYNEQISLCMIDVDHFKKFNDTRGHLMGNDVLVQVAKILAQSLRQTDVVARYGGEEFVVILPKSPRDIGYKMAERIRKSVEEYRFEGEETQPGGKITISLGVSSFPQDCKESNDVSVLIEQADQALYKSKKEGRNKVTLYENSN